MTWNNGPQAQANGGNMPVSVLLAHKDMGVTTAWYQSLQTDPRFRITSMANNAQDFRAKLASSREVILLDATVCDGPAPLIESLTSVTGAGYLTVPGGLA